MAQQQISVCKDIQNTPQKSCKKTQTIKGIDFVFEDGKMFEVVAADDSMEPAQLKTNYRQGIPTHIIHFPNLDDSEDLELHWDEFREAEFNIMASKPNPNRDKIDQIKSKMETKPRFKDSNGFMVHKDQKVTLEGFYEYYEDEVRDVWNALPDWKKEHVKNLVLKTNDKENGGAMNGTKVVLSFTSDPHDNDSTPKSLLEHELGHVQLEMNWSIKKIKEWVSRTRDIGSISDYTSDYVHDSPVWKYMTKKAMVLHDSINSLISMEKQGKDSAKHPEYKDLKKWILDYWNLTEDDITNGKLEYLSNKYHAATFAIYENEQHSDFLAAYNGEYLDGFCMENYNQLKEVYEDMELRDDPEYIKNKLHNKETALLTALCQR